MRPITTMVSGLGRVTELLYQTRRRVGKLGTLALPVVEAIHLYAQRLLPLWSFRVVETHTLDETAIARVARIGHDHVEERTLLGAAARKANNDHVLYPQKRSARFYARYRRNSKEKDELSGGSSRRKGRDARSRHKNRYCCFSITWSYFPTHSESRSDCRGTSPPP